MSQPLARVKLAMKALFGNLKVSENMIAYYSGIAVQSPWATLSACRQCMDQNIPGAYLRFGDGDLNLLEGYNELLQHSTGCISSEMREAFLLCGTGVIKGLPLHSPRFGLYDGMAPGIFGASDEWAERLLSRCYLYFIGVPIYSSVALSYLSVFDRQFAINFLRFLRSQTPLFAGNGEIPALVRQSLFGSEQWVLAPSKDAYSAIDDIEKRLLMLLNERNRPFDVIVTAMGCSGRVLAKRILQDKSRKLFIFDFGSLMDAFCGWSTRAWIDIAGLSQSYFDEMLVSIREND